MAGGFGDDAYVVEVAGDVVTEGVNAGIDTVRASLSYTLGANVENLVLTGTAAVNGTGNTLDNSLVGNAGANLLTGNAGNDRLDGAGGGDILKGGAGNDVYVMARGYGTEIVQENDATVGNTDVPELHVRHLGRPRSGSATSATTSKSASSAPTTRRCCRTGISATRTTSSSSRHRTARRFSIRKCRTSSTRWRRSLRPAWGRARCRRRTRVLCCR